MRLAAFFTAFIAISLLALSANIFFTGLAPRTEHALGSSATIMSPADRIQKSQIGVYPDKAIIEVQGLKWANVSATNSMLPVLGTGAHALQVVPRSANEIQTGDIVSYKYEGRIIIHRVIEIGRDELGWYAITKGDNNPEPDPAPVRFSQIDRVLVGIIY
ncbi:MAG: signal peptidase I [Candidatus Woesearchaeota archaeon]